MAGAFTGFTKKTIAFYRGLEKHNDQAWFEAHREDYLTQAMEPAQALVLELGPKVQALRPGIGFSPDYNGKGSIKKIHTDRRFNPDRDPYKSWLDIMFWEGPLKAKKDNSIFGLRLTAGELYFFAGLKHFDPKVLKVFRAATADEATGPALAKLAAKLAKQEYTLGGVDGYKQVPRGFAADHPRAELLRHNGMFAMHKEPVSEVVFTPKLSAYALKHFKAMLPLHAWCVDVLTRLD